MLKKGSIGFLTIGLLALLLTSCSDYQKLVKSTDYDLKYKKAIEYFDKKDYTRASALMFELIPIYRGTEKVEEISYRYAYCYFHQQDYTMAGYYFKNFIASFPVSQYTEECAYMIAYCYYMDSPHPNLDQTNTYKAMEELQIFMNQHPTSPRVADCNKLIDELREKLVRKSFDSASLYYKLGEYKAAISALNNGLKDFPDTHYREDLMFLILKSSYDLAMGSVADKMKERFQNASDSYQSFSEEFPDSKHKREAERIYNNALKYLK
ncbi:MAG: outer membrane protein assembly factor BamD [Bacteroidales bacterium]|nr:outer membrane protein assembly factor BamD [Bacteroidales bacterium]